MYFLIYVDDMLIIGNNTKAIQQLLTTLHKAFSIKELRLASLFLGIQILCTNHGYFLNQSHYAPEILNASGFTNCKSTLTPHLSNRPNQLNQDFTVEQDDLTPTQGWKSYYAATKAIVNVNAEFCNIIKERSLPAMGRFWLHADYVKCIHSSGELYMGFNAVMNSWAAAFNWAPGVAFQIRDVRARVSGDMAWVTMKAYIDLDSDQFFMTNVYEFHEGHWYMVHHHSTIMVMDGDPGPGQPNGFA
ncbi:hypothetical protein KFK09_023058 [Dendrobium nobile]|uniref:SnoaL-like domain-containing protein n=1 Tax=Dendrobium nobile TaxID=94219 RepID=A0A8T3AL19_DENNO|nr:hypothetical protein KFK09_023058 [Dendrobium nobile]